MKSKQRTLNTNARTIQEGNLSPCTVVISGECGGPETCGDRWLTSAQHALYLQPPPQCRSTRYIYHFNCDIPSSAECYYD